MTTREFCETQFSPASRPSPNSIRNWINTGKLKGRKIGGIYYVFVDSTDHDIQVDEAAEEDIQPNFDRYLKGE